MFSLEFVFSTNIPSFVVQPIVFLAAGVYFYKRRSSLKENWTSDHNWTKPLLRPTIWSKEIPVTKITNSKFSSTETKNLIFCSWNLKQRKGFRTSNRRSEQLEVFGVLTREKKRMPIWIFFTPRDRLGTSIGHCGVGSPRPQLHVARHTSQTKKAQNSRKTSLQCTS